MKIKVNKHVEVTYHFITDEIVFIDLYYVPVKKQGQGLGRDSFQDFLNILPKDVREIRLVAGTNITGRVNIFWTKLGFDYLYDIQEDETEVDEDILYAMTLPVNGAKQKKLIYRHSLDDDGFY